MTQPQQQQGEPFPLPPMADFDAMPLPPRPQPHVGAIVLPDKCHDCRAPLNWAHIHLIYGTAYCHACAASGRED